MKRRDFIIGLVVAAPLSVAATAALALSYAEDVVAQLSGMGFSDIEVETTWLGRVRITARRADGIREIVINPRTGEVLRDVWTPSEGVGRVRPVLDDVGEDHHGDSGGSDDNSGSGGSGGDDDNSGHGGGDDHGGNSGPGGGGGDDGGHGDDKGDRKGD